MAKKKKRTNNQTAKQTESTPQNQPTNKQSADARPAFDGNADTINGIIASTTQSALESSQTPVDKTKAAQVELAAAPHSVERPWLPWLFLALTVAGIYFNQLTSYSLIDPGEAINSESARQMLLLKNYFVPYCNFQIDSHSFVLPSWLVALSYQLSTPAQLTARLPFAIVAALLVLSTYLTTKRLVDRESALTAALITCAAPLLLVSTKTDTTSLSFALCLDLAIYATALAIFARVKYAWILLWPALALAVLCRGPVALALYAIALSLFVVATKVKLTQLKYWLMRLTPAPGIALLLLCTLPVFYFAGPTYLKGLGQYPNYTGFYLPDSAKSDWLYYLPVLAYGLAPWFLLLPQALKNHFFVPLNESWFGGRLNFKSSYRPYNKDRIKITQPDDAELAPVDVERLSLFLFTTFALVYLLIFSFSKLQSDTFVLPVVAPLSISLGVIAQRLAKPWQKQYQEASDPLKWDRFWLQCIFGIICALTLGVSIFIGWAAFLPSAQARPDWLLLTSTIPLLVAAILQVLAIKNKTWQRALFTAVVTMALIIALAHPTLIRYYTNKTQDSFVSLALQLKEAPYDIVLLGSFRPSINTYLNRPVATINDTSALSKTGDKGTTQRRLLLVTDKPLSELQAHSSINFVEVLKQGAWTCYGLSDVEIKH